LLKKFAALTHRCTSFGAFQQQERSRLGPDQRAAAEGGPADGEVRREDRDERTIKSRGDDPRDDRDDRHDDDRPKVKGCHLSLDRTPTGQLYACDAPSQFD
jgi:hypothetical protein